MSMQSPFDSISYQWTPQPDAAAFITRWANQFSDQNEIIRELSRRMHDETGTRLVDWIDHLVISESDASDQQLTNIGFERESSIGSDVWHHQQGLFPCVRRVNDGAPAAMAIKVESIEAFLAANGLEGVAAIHGQPLDSLRIATIPSSSAPSLLVVERHGNMGFEFNPASPEQIAYVTRAQATFADRQRSFDRDADGFAHAIELFGEVANVLGRDWACDLFFASERSHWADRNQAARLQRARQDQLGLGWANHDHHTYRSSREHFARLIQVLEVMGFRCRERFYAGAQAGWGAQVLEHPQCGIVIFADVDLLPEEVAGDFAHDGLSPRDDLGTVGLWCRLHGESFLQAGMHHLECQFDFDAARTQLAAEGIKTMAPFTDFPYLKQAFTEGERWPVDPRRLASLVARGSIDQQQADEFQRQGALGSHLEILQRNDGYKGFNQTGISEIIHKTDPRLNV